MEYEPNIFHEKTLTSVEADIRAGGREFLEVACTSGMEVEAELFPRSEASTALMKVKEGLSKRSAVLVMP